MQQTPLFEAIRQAVLDTADDSGIAKLAEVGNHLRDQGIDYKQLGYPKLTMLLNEYEGHLTLWQDRAFSPPVTLVRWLAEGADAAASGLSVEACAASGTVAASEPGSVRPVETAIVDPADAQTSTLRRGNIRTGMKPGNELIGWAYLVHIPTMLGQLAAMAQPEEWTLPGGAEDEYGILMNYLKYTFVRLRREGKVLEDFENGVAAFNTGLVDRRFEPIHAFFEPNVTGQYAQRWRLQGFCIAGEDMLGKRLVAAFNPLPEPPVYFRSLHDMFYDIGASEPVMDYEHILLENVDRLPREYLLEYCNGGELEDFIRKTPYELGISADRYNEDLAARIRADMRFYRRLIGRFRESVGIAIKRVRWNYKTAIPMYFPTRNIMSLLLPLALVDDDQADVALVVERLDNGNYLGHTILTLQMAYNNARLVCRLESDWLRVGAARFGVFPELQA